MTWKYFPKNEPLPIPDTALYVNELRARIDVLEQALMAMTRERDDAQKELKGLKRILSSATYDQETRAYVLSDADIVNALRPEKQS